MLTGSVTPDFVRGWHRTGSSGLGRISAFVAPLALPARRSRAPTGPCPITKGRNEWLTCRYWLVPAMPLCEAASYAHLSGPAMPLFSRRNILQQSAVGFGYLATMSMLQDEAAAQAAIDPLAPKQPHFPARAKRVIFLFMKGGPSQVDTFDYKPELQKRDGQELPFDKPRVQFAATGKLLKSPWQFRQHGESGQRAFSERRKARRRSVRPLVVSRHKRGSRRSTTQAAHRQ